MDPRTFGTVNLGPQIPSMRELPKTLPDPLPKSLAQDLAQHCGILSEALPWSGNQPFVDTDQCFGLYNHWDNKALRRKRR